MLTRTQIKKIEKSKRDGSGVDIRISLTQMRKQSGGNLFSTLMSAIRTVGPTILKTAGLAGTAGLVSGGVEKLMKGSGFISVPQDKVDKLIKYEKYLTTKQRDQIVRALQTGSGISRLVFSRKQQEGGWLGALLASIGLPLVLKALKGGGGIRVEPPHFSGQGLHVEPYLPSNTIDVFVPPKVGRGRGKKIEKKGKGLLLGPNSPFKDVPILGAIL